MLYNLKILSGREYIDYNVILPTFISTCVIYAHLNVEFKDSKLYESNVQNIPDLIYLVKN